MRVLLLLPLAACAVSTPDAELPPPTPVALDLCKPATVTPGAVATFEVTGATPGATVSLVRGGPPRGRPTCFGGGACTSLSNPALLGQGTADGAGTANVRVTVPRAAPLGAMTGLQAFELRSGGAVASNVARVTLSAPDDLSACADADVCVHPDLDGDLLTDTCDADADGDGDPRPGDCDDRDASVYAGTCPVLDPVTCATLRASGRTQDGLYRIDPDGAGGEPEIAAWCDMTRDGGGWTLVMRGSERTSGGTNWNNEVGAIAPEAWGSLDDRTWKYPDAIISALLTETYRVEGDGYVDATRFLSADCPWQQSGSVLRHPACSQCFLDPDLTVPDAPHGSLHGWWYGLACGTGVIITAHEGPDVFVGWALAPAGHPVDGNGDGRWDTCDGQPGVHRGEMTDTVDCNLTMWVR